MYLTETQFDILRSWAEQTPQVRAAYLSAVTPKVKPIAEVMFDVAVEASPGNWTRLAADWERELSEAIGVTVNVRTLANDTVLGYCAEFSLPLKGV